MRCPANISIGAWQYKVDNEESHMLPKTFRVDGSHPVSSWCHSSRQTLAGRRVLDLLLSTPRTSLGLSLWWRRPSSLGWCGSNEAFRDRSGGSFHSCGNDLTDNLLAIRQRHFFRVWIAGCIYFSHSCPRDRRSRRLLFDGFA